MSLTSHSEVAEMQGFYGPVRISERTIQRIWFEKRFNLKELKTLSGKAVRIIDSGRWNQNEGPDFKSAVIEIGDTRLEGDIEIHFYSQDWEKHAHDKDPEYNNVILHVVVYENRKRTAPCVTASGKAFETVELLNVLVHDIESYQDDENLIDFQNAHLPEWIKKINSLDEKGRLQFVWYKARKRWLQKCEFTRSYLRKNSWQNACHQLTLEVLGYSRNRAPMAKIALEHDFNQCRSGMLDPEKVYNKYEGEWKLKGVRPANQPKRRLAQYFSALEDNGECFELLYQHLLKTGPSSRESINTIDYRREFKISPLRQRIVAGVFSNVFRGTRSDTLMVDAYLPLFSIASDIDIYELWFHWFMGDVPEWVRASLKDAGFGKKTQPYCNGLAQAMIQCYYESYTL